MNATYKVVFFYPDRHIEEVDEIFYSEEKAKPSFMVIEIGGDKKYTVVFDSKE